MFAANTFLKQSWE